MAEKPAILVLGGEALHSLSSEHDEHSYVYTTEFHVYFSFCLFIHCSYYTECPAQ